MQRDKRQIQTAVLGSADSEEPLVLPLEAIELDAFRTVHENDSFWCGLLLGGCGGRLTTKLYTDRVCHFAHHPGPDGQPHICIRRSRSVNSADHLYVKSATVAWLRSHGTQADVDFAQESPLGSVVDIQLTHKKLRVHLDQSVAPQWDGVDEPVLGMSVPVDQDTLIKRWYVNRIRLDSEGTSRRVRIGTEAFARPIEWFSLDECEVTERGLSTPAVERIIQAHSTPSPARWTPGKKQETSPQDERAQDLMRRLLYARRTESPDLTAAVCREIAELSGVSSQLQGRLEAARHSALLWAEKEIESRRAEVHRLNRAVAAEKLSQVKSLITEVKRATKVDRTGEEEAAIRAAAEYLTAAIPAALTRLNGLLEEVSRIPANGDAELLALKIQQITHETDELARVGKGVRHPRAELSLWKDRLESLLVLPPGSPAPGPLHQLVGRGYWTAKTCPLCGADRGQQCVTLDGPRAGQLRDTPHADRLRLFLREIGERKSEESGSPSTVWQVYDVTCPACRKEPGAWCRSPGRPHALRYKLAAEFTQQRKPHLETKSSQQDVYLAAPDAPEL
ncbi:zinc finger domain-containing protein [Streptomyces globisporus]|uniref:zinc finger domain-containing protein n=1 Tax=Streptomyces globisporus TaxID=1908 RepID=UPI0037924C88